ncbi:CinA family protein [Helicobacter burdigaliensis]|uniref:CinA family protein n=1 Tax=Helicobacter burdigaliensis TaxID=2315334 RepID=UPI000EF6EB23|nr:CinA family protein [Helicobacter burdigaliensis]
MNNLPLKYHQLFELSAKEGEILLYLLGLDVQSAMLLLQNIATNYKIPLEIYFQGEGIEILLAKGENLEQFCNEVQYFFQSKIFITKNLGKDIINILRKSHNKITTAESCTGGLLAYFLTKEGGASEVYDGGVISYANSIKEAWLEVSSSNLENFGAVSEEVVKEMLQGALKLSGADYAIATSGIAGPSGGSTQKPVGTIFIGVMHKNGDCIIERVFLKGDRNGIQKKTCIYGFLLFLKLFYNNY